MSSMRQVCTFRVGEGLFGLGVERVQEVLRDQPLTRVTLAPPLIRGLLNLRGEIVMAVDLRRCLGLDPLPIGPKAMNLVIRTDDGPVSFLVDRILDVILLDDNFVAPPPPNLEGTAKAIVLGVCPAGPELLLIVDPDSILAMIEPLPGELPGRAFAGVGPSS